MQEQKAAVVYLRVSSDNQVREGHGIEGQLLACRKRAEKNSVHILETFQDEAISGARLDRPGLTDAIKFIAEKNKRATRVHYFLSTEISRISRPEHLDEGFAILTSVRKHNCSVVDANSGAVVERGDDMQILFSMIKLSQAKAEREAIMKRSYNGVAARLKDGYRAFSHPPIGYIYQRTTDENGKKSNRAVRDEPSASVLQAALEKFAKGEIKQKKDLREYLEDHAFNADKRSKSYYRNRNVQYRLLDPERLYFYAGYILKPDYEVEEPVKGKHEPLISEATLKRILFKLEGRPTAQSLKETYDVKDSLADEFPLRQTLRCGGCGRFLSGAFSTSKSGKKHAYYSCPNGKCKYGRKSLRRSDIHAQVEEKLASIRFQPVVREITEAFIADHIQQRSGAHERKTSALKAQIVQIEKEQSKLADVIAKVEVPALIARYQEIWKDKDDELAKLRVALEAKEAEEAPVALYEHLDKALSVCERPLEMRKTGGRKVKQAMLRLLYERSLRYTPEKGLRTPQTVRSEAVFQEVPQGGGIS